MAIILSNNFAWIIYSAYLGFDDGGPFLIASVVPGFLLNMWFVLHGFHLLMKRDTPLFLGRANFLVNFVIWGLSENFVIGCVVAFVPSLRNSRQLGDRILSINCIVWSIVTYSGPLTSMAQVIKSKNSNTMDPLLIVAIMFNCGLWFVYALTIGNYAILITNGIGFFLSIIQLTIALIYPNKRLHAWKSSIRSLLEVKEEEADALSFSNKEPESELPTGRIQICV